MLCHHFFNFGPNRYCSSKDIIFSVSNVILQNYMIKGLSDYNDKSSSR